MNFARKERRASTPIIIPPTPPPPDPEPGDWSPLGTNAPPGLTLLYTFDGSTKPAGSYFTGGTANASGMLGLVAQMYALETVDEPLNPTNSAKALRTHYRGTDGGLGPVSWYAEGVAGLSPARFNLAVALSGSGRKPLSLYVHALRRYSANWSEANARQATVTVHASGTSTTGTTRTMIRDAGKAFVPGEHVGKCVRYGGTSSRSIPIASWSGTDIFLPPGFEIGGDLTGLPYQIVSMVASGSTSSNAGTKGLFWPRQKGRLVFSVTDAVQSLYDNHYSGGWVNPNPNTAGASGEGLVGNISLQSGWVWNGSVWTSNNSPFFPDNTPVAPAIYTPGAIFEEEHVLVQNTIGDANGKVRWWLDGTLRKQSDVVPFTRQYYKAGGAGALNGAFAGYPQDSLVELLEGYFDYLYYDPTRGGGLFMPTVDMHTDLLALAVAVSDARLL